MLLRKGFCQTPKWLMVQTQCNKPSVSFFLSYGKSKKVSLVLGQLSFIDWSEIHSPSTWQLHLHHFIMWLLQLLCWVGGIKLLEVERGWSTTCGRYSWAKTDITFTHTLLAGNSPVTCPHLTAKDTGKYSLAVWPEGRGNGFHDT